MVNKQKDGDCVEGASNWMCSTGVASGSFDAPRMKKLYQLTEH
jgi:hypothetical protein